MIKLPDNKEIVRLFSFAVQKTRSDLLEIASEATLSHLGHPWLFGPNCILRAVELLGDKEPTMNDVMNLLWIATQEPLIGLVGGLHGLPTFEEYMEAQR